MLEFPLHDGFFPQIALSREEVKYYKRLGKERVTQLIRIIEDADCAYKWTNGESSSHRTRSRLPGRSRLNLDTKEDQVTCQQAQFLDFQPANKSTHASTLLKASVQLTDTKVDEILRAVAKIKTKDFRKSMRYMHDDVFVDGRTLFTFPTSNRVKDNENGKKKPHPGSSVVAFCVQESISREREVPTLENFGIARGYLSRMGMIVSKTHQPNTFRVTSICQIDGDLNPIVRGVLEDLMKRTVCAVARIPGLVARQRDMIFQMRESRDRDRRQSDLALEVLEAPLEEELKPAELARKISVSPKQQRAQDKMLALTDVVSHIREIRDTINIAMSEADYGDHQLEDSDEVEEFNDMYSEITSIREALESSVSNFDAALANTTGAAPAMYYSGPSDRSHDSLRDGDSEREDAMTADQFDSVARITFAAARATKQAGQAFLSTCSSDLGDRLHLSQEALIGLDSHGDFDDDRMSASPASVASYPTMYDSEGSIQSPDPYSASNYEKIMATYQPEHDGSEHDGDDNRTHKFAVSMRRATEIHELEKKIRDLQQSLVDAQRKLSVIDSDEPEPEARSRQRLDAVRERSAQVEIESVFEIFGERDEESYDDSSDDLSLVSSEDFREPHFKKYQGPDAFYVEEDLGAMLKKRKAAEVGTSPPIDPASPSSPLPPAPAVGKDERDELRELMAGLVRPRSSSLPFHSNQMGGASSGEPIHDYDKPSWSDDAPDRAPTRHQVQEAVREIRACLASCRCECPSDTERARKLTSIFKVLRSLHREGVRSKFRTLQHDDIRYSKMLKATPSIIKLLKLAGYVSLQQKLTMRRVDQDYLAVFLRELEQELNSTTVA
ncbi:hypothetical protein BBO99_00001360 [Phytophthora kernoviae]|uniref:Uncharacterized protein n=2 Tax=Phytophthora kernoviae TaxID=325452 RepID=A0A3R7H437_9STRA|nr:hypothetical protein JM16_005601 [Phytophthora kernoviae]KAG2530774.1 hypothetical protein JM18_001193 [Phytophthora kernoviae]RLN84378.1 hypothetical protein BBO99_00001360 [Phytophthora kernoviae]